jgi:hypothetical protein
VLESLLHKGAGGMECIISQQSTEVSNQNYASTSLCQGKEHPLPTGYVNPRGGLRQQKRQKSFPIRSQTLAVQA